MADLKKVVEKIFKKLDGFSNISQENIEAFCKELQKQNLEEKQKDWLKQYLDLLNEESKNLLQYDIQSQDEFIQRLIMLLNLSNNSSQTDQMLDKTTALIAKFIIFFEQLSHQSVKENNPYLFIQEDLKTPENLERLSKAWDDVIYHQKHLKVQKKISEIISKLIQPCVMVSTQEMKEVANTLKTTPQSITNPEILEVLEEICLLKEKDCKMMKKNSQEIEKNTSDVLSEIESAINNNNNHISEILKIKESIAKKDQDFTKEKEELIETTDILHDKINKINEVLKSKEDKIKLLYDELNTLSMYVKTIEEQAKIDGLTDVYNRKHIDVISEIYERAFLESGINYTILFFDIDNFKHINDIYGHTAGDKLLLVFSKILKQNCRSSDVVGRYGGDEFLILMPNTDVGKAKEFAKRICETIEKTNFVYKDKKLKITTSIGMTDRVSHKSKNDMLDAADNLLYKAKDAGRNQVKWE